VAIWFALSLAWFGLYARHRMILSPEEEFALEAGRGDAVDNPPESR